MSDQLALFDASKPAAARVRRALISACERYRYTLLMRWGEGETLLWTLLNPSTADASKDDPTSRKVVAFSKREGYGAALILNLFAWRDTHPTKLRVALAAGHDLVGPDDAAVWAEALPTVRRAVLGWGNGPVVRKVGPARPSVVLRRLLDAGVEPLCLGLNQDGSPEHPCYLANATPLLAYPVPLNLRSAP